MATSADAGNTSGYARLLYRKWIADAFGYGIWHSLLMVVSIMHIAVHHRGTLLVDYAAADPDTVWSP